MDEPSWVLINHIQVVNGVERVITAYRLFYFTSQAELSLTLYPVPYNTRHYMTVPYECLCGIKDTGTGKDVLVVEFHFEAENFEEAKRRVMMHILKATKDNYQPILDDVRYWVLHG